MKRLGFKWLYKKIEECYRRGKGIVELDLHGRRMLINAGNLYPLIIRWIPLFNLPLVSLVREVHKKLGRPLTIIDCGAAVGDTAFLLDEQCPGAVGQMHCVDGEKEFLSILRVNAPRLPFPIKIMDALLARSAMKIPDLVRHHQGTASAVGGSQKIDATTLDLLFPATQPGEKIDLLKIDIDGYDGEALAGAVQLLRRDRPAVIFEWHPDLILKAGNDPHAAFDALGGAGYRVFLAFHNTGLFSHFGANRRDNLDLWIKYLLHHQKNWDPHFDIIALPDELEDIQLPVCCLGLSRPSSMTAPLR